MKRLLIVVMMLGLGATACGNACDDAVDKLEECGADTSGVDADECNEQDECAAECINDASCAEIEDGSVLDCISKC